MALTVVGALLARFVTAAAVIQAQEAQPHSDTVPELVALQFHRDGGRLLATVDQRFLEADFVVRARVLAVARTDEAGADGAGASEEARPSVGDYRTSGPLRLRQDGDSLVLSGYAGSTRGQFQYRRRAAMAVLRHGIGGALVIDAGPLWAAVAPTTLGDFARPTGEGAWMYDGRTFRLGPRPESSEKPVVVRPTGGYHIGYGLSIDRLPAVPMRPRLADPRIRLYTTTTKEISASGDTTPVEYILRRRLEKKDPTAEVSDVVQPLIYRITKSVPDRLVPAARQAVEAWLPVLESIGFRNALVVRLPTDPPAAKDEQESTIEYAEGPSPGATAGPTLLDERTGEMVTTGILIASATNEFLQRDYFALAGLTNRQARFPFPDSLVQSIFATPLIHEVGHTLGLAHNFKGAGVYPPDSLRRRDFLRRMGTMASVMSYSRLNYVPQLEDSVAYGDFLPRIGVYDRWALSWGYRPILDAATPAAELPTLERWRAVQDTAPYLQSSFAEIMTDVRDPYDQPDVIGDDLLKSIPYGIRNLERLAVVMAKDTMEQMSVGRYGLLASWGNIMRPLPRVIGGQTPQRPYAKKPADVRWQPIDPAYQLRAIRFMVKQLFYAESDLIKLVVGGSASAALRTPVLFDSVASGWSTELGQRVQRTLTAELFNVEHLQQMVAQMSSAQREEMLGVCRELKVLDQQLDEAAQSTVPDRKSQAVAIREMLAPVFNPTNKFCQ